MKGSILWKLGLTIVVAVWAILNLLPVEDRDFGVTLREHVTANADEFEALTARARAQVDNRAAPSLYVALRDLCRAERIDLATRFFPQLPLERTLKNLERRNQIVLDEILHRSKARLQQGLDLQGGVAFVLEVEETPGAEKAEEQRQEELAKAIEIIGSRIDAFGVTEPLIRPVGNNRIEIQLPGVNSKDNPDVINALKKPARLDFRLVHPSARPTGEFGEVAPAGYEVLQLEQEGEKGEPILIPYFVKRVPDLTGEAVDEAYVQLNEVGSFEIGLNFTDEGGRRFGDLTGANVGRQLAIVLDGRLYSAPTIQGAITGGRAQITGRFSQREAFELSNVLNNPLAIPLRVAEMNEVGKTLGEGAITGGVQAAVLGTAGVIAFMTVFYFGAGLIAVASLAVNVLLLLGVLSSIGATLTLPGIAGIVLTIGMAVDSNILIFERIREELRAGKSLKAAFLAGHERAFTTIIDANLTTLITAGIMIAFGTGAVKGFGVTLTIGIFTTMFAALIVSKLILEWLITTEVIKRLPMMPPIRETRFDFMRYARPAFITAFAIVGLGLAAGVFRGRDIAGIDFLGGDEVVYSFKERLTQEQIAAALAPLGLDAAAPIYQTPFGGTGETLRLQVPFGEGARATAALQQAHPSAGLERIGENRIGPAVGAEILRSAILAILLSLVGILIYVGFRFEVGFGVGAVVSTLHDILMTVGVFILLGGQFSAPMVAAILLIVGYSINDTIVVFDRIREELALRPTLKLKDIINLAVNVTLQRTLMTSITTLFASLSLYFFGQGVIQDVALTMIIGIVTGTFSSVFIASPIFYWYHKGDRAKLDGQVAEETPQYEWLASSKASR